MKPINKQRLEKTVRESGIPKDNQKDKNVLRDETLAAMIFV